MQPFASAAERQAYNVRLTSDHDYTLRVHILDMNERALSPAVLVDGQINLSRDNDIRRGGTLTLLDPDRGLGLDSATPFQGALYANKMLRVQHVLSVPGYGDVVATPLIGTISKVNRNGATIDVEVQDKTSLAILGNRPMTVTKGTNAIAAVQSIMSDRCGETKFRLPASTKYRLLRNYSVGWDDEASPWAICSRIARSLGLQLLYSCDGYLTMRPRPTEPVFEFGIGTFDSHIGPNLTSAVAEENDYSSLVNHARTTYGKEVATATAPASHPFGPTNVDFMHNGVPRYLPALFEVDAPDKPVRPGGKKRKASKAQLKKFAIEMEKYADQHKTAKELAQASSDSGLAAGLLLNEDLTYSAIPVYHLDVDDLVRVTTPDGSTVAPFAEASIPLLPGDMSVGQRKVLARPGRIRR